VSGVSISLQANSGIADGLRTETVSDGATAGQVSTILDGAVAYVRGNYLGLRSLMNFTAAGATKEAGHWFFVKRSEPAQMLVYDTVASGLTVSSMVSELPMSGALTLVPLSVVNGLSAYGIKGEKSDDTSLKEELYVRATGTHLPVEMTDTDKGVVVRLAFGAWGRPPSVSAPAKAVPLMASWMNS
jgi:hypothetical protein